MNGTRLLTAGLAALALAAALVAVVVTRDGDGGGQVKVVASTPIVADLVRSVGGERVEVVTLAPPKADPHTFEPPDDAREGTEDAAVAFRAGGDYDAWLEDVIPPVGAAERVALIDAVPNLSRRPRGGPDPHWWLDLGNIADAALVVTSALSEADPDGASEYGRNAEALAERVADLDARLSFCMSSIPPERRRLFTAHDAMRIFAERYRVNFAGSLYGARTSGELPDARAERLLDRLRDLGVRAVFPEAGVDAAELERIALDLGVPLADPLWVDTLGEEDGEPESLLGGLIATGESIARGLGGDRQVCDLSNPPGASGSPFGS
ncbi:MAG TPA: metal ABC transporter substrate-binding protein [Solirubrobacterales bacterium]|jgi:ABC-type Zn uptake system ZnuABC Zn-binding protein ZnuA